MHYDGEVTQLRCPQEVVDPIPLALEFGLLSVFSPNLSTQSYGGDDCRKPHKAMIDKVDNNHELAFTMMDSALLIPTIGESENFKSRGDEISDSERNIDLTGDVNPSRQMFASCTSPSMSSTSACYAPSELAKEVDAETCNNSEQEKKNGILEGSMFLVGDLLDSEMSIVTAAEETPSCSPPTSPYPVKAPRSPMSLPLPLPVSPPLPAFLMKKLPLSADPSPASSTEIRESRRIQNQNLRQLQTPAVVDARPVKAAIDTSTGEIIDLLIVPSVVDLSNELLTIGANATGSGGKNNTIYTETKNEDPNRPIHANSDAQHSSKQSSIVSQNNLISHKGIKRSPSSSNSLLLLASDSNVDILRARSNAFLRERVFRYQYLTQSLTSAMPLVETYYDGDKASLAAAFVACLSKKRLQKYGMTQCLPWLLTNILYALGPEDVATIAEIHITHCGGLGTTSTGDGSQSILQNWILPWTNGRVLMKIMNRSTSQDIRDEVLSIDFTDLIGELDLETIESNASSWTLLCRHVRDVSKFLLSDRVHLWLSNLSTLTMAGMAASFAWAIWKRRQRILATSP